jgi:hypothetical protein
MMNETFSKTSKRNALSHFYIEPEYIEALKQRGLSSIDDIFAFQGGRNLVKDNLAPYRSRIQFQAGTPVKTFFLKRYFKPP